MADTSPRVLLIEPNPTLRELHALVLSEAGYHVDELPNPADPVAFAEQTKPQVIVIGMRFSTSDNWEIIDRLRATPDTRAVPVVAISVSAPQAAAAAASTNVSATVVAPYDIVALEKAVSTALGKPPAAATLPTPAHAVPLDQIAAANALQQQSRMIVLRSIGLLLRSEPYRRHFTGITPETVDCLGLLLGALVEGLRADLPPDQVFASPAVETIVLDHLCLRKGQGIGMRAVVQETLVLEKQIDTALQGLIGPDFSAASALEVFGKVRDYLHVLALIEIADYDQV